MAGAASARVQGLESSRAGETTGLLSSSGAGAGAGSGGGGGGGGRSVGFSDTVELASFEHLLWQEIGKVRKLVVVVVVVDVVFVFLDFCRCASLPYSVWRRTGRG